MATRAAAFCLEMLRFGHPERVPQSSSGTRLGGSMDAKRVYGHSRSSFLLGNA